MYIRRKIMSGKIRLIASDLDGTLLLDGAQSLRPENLQADSQPDGKGDLLFCRQRQAVSEFAETVCAG